MLLVEQLATDISVSPEALEKHVITLSRVLPPRHDDTDNLDASARYIKQELLTTGGKVYEQEYKVWGIPYRNIIAEFGPDSESRIVVGAHYDTADGLPGADDNASGVAGLIELAKLLGKTKLNKKVELVAYTLEEPPYFRTKDMGSAVHAQSLKDKGIDVEVMISLEMIGYFSDEPDSQEFPVGYLKYFYPTEGNFIAVVGGLGNMGVTRKTKKAMRSASSLPVHSINAPASIPGIDFSDHLNYWKQGYEAIMITDTAFFRNKNYHTHEDTAEKLDYERMAEVVKGVYAAALRFSGGK